MDTHIIGPKMLVKADTQVQPRTLMVLDVQVDLTQTTPGLMYDVMPNLILKEECPNLVTIPLLHNVESLNTHCVPHMVVNLSQEGIFLPKGHMMGHLEPTSISAEEITTETSFIQTEVPEEILKDETIPLEKKFITSPADIERHRKVELPDAEVSEKHKKQFAALCEKYDDIFSKGSADIGKTPLITMEIDTGDSPPICQRPYNLPLTLSGLLYPLRVHINIISSSQAWLIIISDVNCQYCPEWYELTRNGWGNPTELDRLT